MRNKVLGILGVDQELVITCLQCTRNGLAGFNAAGVIGVGSTVKEREDTRRTSFLRREGAFAVGHVRKENAGLSRTGLEGERQTNYDTRKPPFPVPSGTGSEGGKTLSSSMCMCTGTDQKP